MSKIDLKAILAKHCTSMDIKHMNIKGNVYMGTWHEFWTVDRNSIINAPEIELK